MNLSIRVQFVLKVWGLAFLTSAGFNNNWLDVVISHSLRFRYRNTVGKKNKNLPL